MTCGDFEALNRRKVAGKVFLNKAFIIAKNMKYDGCECGPALMV